MVMARGDGAAVAGPERLATFIIRTFEPSSPVDELRGTVARPGGEEHPFRSLQELGQLLSGGVPEPEGNDAGSTSSSSIREA